MTTANVRHPLSASPEKAPVSVRIQNVPPSTVNAVKKLYFQPLLKWKSGLPPFYSSSFTHTKKPLMETFHKRLFYAKLSVFQEIRNLNILLLNRTGRNLRSEWIRVHIRKVKARHIHISRGCLSCAGCRLSQIKRRR